MQEDHGVARVNAEQGNRYVDTSDDDDDDDDDDDGDDDDITDDSISIPDQDHLDIEVAKLLAARNSPDKIDLVGKIYTESQAPTDSFLYQLSKDLAEDKKQGPNISPHLAVIISNLWQQNISGDKLKIDCQNIQCQRIVTISLFLDAMRRSGMVRVYSSLT